MNSKQNDLQPPGQVGGSRKAGWVAGEVGVLRSSVDLWDSITPGERREGTYPNALRRSEGSGDGRAFAGLPAPKMIRQLPFTLCRKAKVMRKNGIRKAGCGKTACPV